MRKWLNLFESSDAEVMTRQVRDQYAPYFRGSCEGAAGDLANMLNRAGIPARAIEGEVDYPVVIDGVSYETCPHCWVETESLILDPTVEQFETDHFVVPKDSMVAKRYHGREELDLTEADHELDEGLVTKNAIDDVIFNVVSMMNMSPQDINRGRCYEFAFLVINALGGQTPDTFPADPSYQVSLEDCGQTYDPTAPKHCFIVHNRRVYDSETPEGRDRWQDLPYFQRSIW